MVNITISGEGHKEVCDIIIAALHKSGHGGPFIPSSMQGHSSFLVLWKNQPVTDAEKK